ncbi:MAG: hypothetical protein FJ395_05940 [Verrucomicrobia bacterium]|nr:hypothetical protein [Verrucomicrobiota bacterium]
MMTCRQIEKELSAYIDGELADAARAEVRMHLDACDRCRRHLAQLEQLGNGVARLPQLAPPPGFAADVRRKISGNDTQRSWMDVVFRPVWLKVPVEAVAVVAVAVGVMFLAQHQQKRQACICYTTANEVSAASATLEARKDTDALSQLSERREVADTAPAPSGAPEPVAPASPAAVKRALALKAEPAGRPLERGADASQMTAGGHAGRASGTDATATLALVDNQQRMLIERETVLVAAVNPSLAEERVRELLNPLRGAVVEVKKGGPMPHQMRVRVPSALVAKFKEQLAEINADPRLRPGLVRSRQLAAVATDEKKMTEKLEKPEEEPMTELEIQIVEPLKP